MSEVVWRLLVAGGIVIVALGFSAARRIRDRRAAATAPLDLSGLDGRVIFFTDSACRTCARARGVLEASGISFEEVAYDHEPELMRRVGVVGVPLVVARDEQGHEVGRIAGVPGHRALQRLLGRAGLVL